MFSKETSKLQADTLPEGYHIVTAGRVFPGDIRWNPWIDEWITGEPVMLEKHSLIIGDPVANLPGICRKNENNPLTQPAENRVYDSEPAIGTEYVILSL